MISLGIAKACSIDVSEANTVKNASCRVLSEIETSNITC